MRTHLGVVSTRVLQEYFNAATKKLRLDAALARIKVELLASMSAVQIDPTLILAAIDLHRLHHLSLCKSNPVRWTASPYLKKAFPARDMSKTAD